jgi:hypothetical protein
VLASGLRPGPRIAIFELVRSPRMLRQALFPYADAL